MSSMSVTKLQGLPQLADVTSDQQANAATATLTIDRDRAGRFGIQPTLIDATIYDAIGQREVTQYFTQINAYHVVLEVAPALQTDPRLFDKLYLTSPTTAQQVPVSYFMRTDMTKTGLSRHQSSEPVPIGDGKLQSWGRGGARRCGDGGSAGRGRARA
jgi:hydrophobic/amphiphilic exporter-1 (mainly G- bacteria), HAE1 family